MINFIFKQVYYSDFFIALNDALRTASLHKVQISQVNQPTFTFRVQQQQRRKCSFSKQPRYWIESLYLCHVTRYNPRTMVNAPKLYYYDDDDDLISTYVLKQQLRQNNFKLCFDTNVEPAQTQDYFPKTGSLCSSCYRLNTIIDY